MRFSIFNVPMKRRIETFACLMVVTLGPIMALLGVVLIFQPYSHVLRLLMILYSTWAIFIDKAPVKGGRPIEFYRNLSIWKHFRDYFPAKLIVKQKLDSSKKYVFCLHPHGIIGMSMWPTLFMGCENAKERLGVDYRICTVSVNFKIPIWRESVLSFGFIDASPKSFKGTLEKGISVCLVVGGAREALLAKPGELNLTLKMRKGFVKYALQTGAGLVPVFSFGENELYNTIKPEEGSFLQKLQLSFMKQFGFSTPLFMGRGVFNLDMGLLPYRKECFTVVGEPLDLPRVEEPDQETIDKWHAEYIKRLEKLYEENKVACGYEKMKLVISE